MNKIIIAFFFSCLAILTGCNGSSGENESSENLIPASISLSILNDSGSAQNSFDVQDTVTLTALVLDSDGKTVSNKTVTFTVDIGELSLSSKLTDANGYATVTVSNPSTTLGAGSATATVESLSDSKDYEFIVSDGGEIKPGITTQLLLNDEAVNQFTTDEQVLVTTTLLDAEGLPVSGEIISFTADVGQLSASSALTVNGVAQVTLSSEDGTIGAGILTATLTDADSETVTNRINYEIVETDIPPVDTEVRLGYFDEDNNFVEGVIDLEIDGDTISAGGSLGLSVALVDSTNTLVSAPTSVTFSSNCVINGNAVIDESSISIKGKAGATYEDINCAGTSGTDDIIVASITVNEVTNTASATIKISGEQLGSIEFVSAEPTSIVLKGTGGQETSTLTFLVKSALGNTLAQQAVDFTLNTTVGGISLSRSNGFTNSQGLVTTQVAAGTVPTAVRVTAKASMTVDGVEESVQTQSDLLSINTGLPEQRSLTIAAGPLNPEASLNGETSTISVWLADNFNNPSPDGTTVNFTTEGGVIEPSCTTVNGYCSVTWTASQPRVDDHRVTILATAVGHETFFDTNGNNIFDDADGDAIVDPLVSSGAGRHDAEASGFVDMSEAWRDDNENNVYDAGEVFLDFDNNQAFSTEDSLFNGPQCEGANCASTNSLHVRKSLTLIMSSSSGNFILSNEGTVYVNTLDNISNDLPAIDDGTMHSYQLAFSDSVGQALPAGTTISVTSTVGVLNGVTNTSVGNTNQTGAITFLLENPIDGDPENGLLTITITSPSGVTTTLIKPVSLL